MGHSYIGLRQWEGAWRLGSFKPKRLSEDTTFCRKFVGVD